MKYLWYIFVVTVTVLFLADAIPLGSLITILMLPFFLALTAVGLNYVVEWLSESPFSPSERSEDGEKEEKER